MAGWLAAAGGAALVLFLALTPTGCYLTRAAWEEGAILRARRPIASLVRDSSVPRATRDKLRLVLDARRFAVDSVHLRAGESFTAYSELERDTLVLVLSAAYRDALEPYTWWFPVVGRVPYKGFFDFGAARGAAQELESRGFDSYLRPSAAFSTLGWFNDPLLSTTLELDSVGLANTVVHELTHNTFYASGEAVFNESFANFVGGRGAEWFFRVRGDSALAARAAAEWQDERALGAFWGWLYGALDSAYAAQPGDRAARLAARDSLYALARVRLRQEVAPRLGIPLSAVDRVVLNNAALLARRIYLTRLELFERVYALEGRDLPRTIRRVMALAKGSGGDPYGAVARWVKGRDAAPRPGAPSGAPAMGR